MASRPIWKGTLQFGLVGFPIERAEGRRGGASTAHPRKTAAKSPHKAPKKTAKKAAASASRAGRSA
jgi:hypothetical protein